MKLLQYGKTENGLYQIEFLIEPEQFELALARAYRKAVGTIAVPGFRKGKAPRSVIEKMYGEEVFFDDALNALLPIEYDAAVHAVNIDPIASPQIDATEVSKEHGATILCKVPVKPDVTLGEYKGLKATKTVKAVTEEDIASEILGLQNRNARMIEKDTPAQDGDFTTIDFEGFVDGVAFEGGKSEGYPLQLGSGQFIPGFEEQIVGHTVGETFDIEVVFPEEYQAEDLAGKTATFKIFLHEVKVKEMPELDDEFAKDVSEFDTLAELKADLMAKAAEDAEKQAQSEVENALLEQVVTSLEADIPEIMFTQKMEEMANEFAYRLQSQGLNLDTYLQYTGSTAEAFVEGFRVQAEQQVKMRLALDHIVDLEEIKIEKEEIDAQYAQMAEQFGMEEAEIRQAIHDHDIRGDLAANKAVDFLFANAVVTTEGEKKPAKKAAAKKETAKKEPAKKTAAKKADDTKKETKKPAAKKDAAEPKKEAAKKEPAKKTAAKKAEPKEKKGATEKKTATKAKAKKEDSEASEK